MNYIEKLCKVSWLNPLNQKWNLLEWYILSRLILPGIQIFKIKSKKFTKTKREILLVVQCQARKKINIISLQDNRDSQSHIIIQS